MLEGLPPNDAAHVMRLSCDRQTAQQIVDIIVETFDPADTAAAAFAERADQADPEDGPWGVEAYFGGAPDETQVRALLAAGVGPRLAEAARFSRVATCDWVSASLVGLKPVRVGRFFLHGAHDRDRAHINDIAIEVEAALAFGTGHHGSTRGCLSCLGAVAKRRRPCRILDVGTGTGVLAIAAAKIFHVPVMAGDIDPVAIATARANARRNGAAAMVTSVCAPGLAHPALKSGAPYDLVMANILAAPLRQLAPDLASIVAAGGDLILSGLLGRDVAGIVNAYGMQRFARVGRLDIDGWATLLMRRPR